MKTLHLLSLPWTHTTRAHLACAYTQKAVKFCQMFAGNPDYRVVLYSNEENEAPADEHVPIFSSATRDALFGQHDPNDAHSVATWDDNGDVWRAWNRIAGNEVAKRADPEDLILMTAPCHAAVANRNAHLVSMEYGIGYERTWSPRRVFESYAWMHYVLGQQHAGDGSELDAVVPNYFNPADFTPAKKVSPGLTYLGRMIDRKGVAMAVEIAREAGRPLILAGPGATVRGGILSGPALAPIGLDYDMEYVGPVNAEERKELLAESHAILMPTRYVEPFGGVAIEAMLSGRPVLASDFGAFTETLPREWRFSGLSDAVRACEALDGFGSQASYRVRREAVERWSLDAVRPQYAHVFERYAG